MGITTTTDAVTTTTEAEITTTEAETTTKEAAYSRVTVLANPTPIFVSESDGTIYDDTYQGVTLPFPVSVSGSSSSTVYVSVNGFLSLSDIGAFFTNHPPLPKVPLALLSCPTGTISSSIQVGFVE